MPQRSRRRRRGPELLVIAAGVARRSAVDQTQPIESILINGVALRRDTEERQMQDRDTPAPRRAGTEGVEIDGLEALLAAGRRLLEVSPESFAKALAVARAFVAIFDRPDEPDEVFAS